MTLVEAILALAVLAVVPLAMPLLPGVAARAVPASAAVGAIATLALLIDPGPLGALLALPWLALAVLAAVAVGRRWWDGARTVPGVVWVVACAYLVVGAAWLVADRGGWQPVGVAPPFVRLTAVHFHYAGFAAAVLAGRTWQSRPDDLRAAVAAALVVASPPVVAAGFTWFGALQVLGAVALAAGLWLLTWVVLRDVLATVAGPTRTLLAASAISVIVPMLLAVQWAVGTNLGLPALSIPAMARTHGVLNAVGFALLGVLGWRRVDAEVERVG